MGPGVRAAGGVTRQAARYAGSPLYDARRVTDGPRFVLKLKKLEQSDPVGV